MSLHAELPFERFRYWQGQMVRARDFTAQLAEAERLGRWHQRAIHNAFGVRFGFEVTLDAASSEPRVRIGCGVAFDCSGALLVLQRPREIEVPDLRSGESLSLVVRTRGAGGACGCGCGGAGVEASPGGGAHHLLEDDLELTWSPRRGEDPRHGVLLARVSRADSGDVVVDSTARVLTRPLARPRLGSGATIAGRTAWEPWAAGMQTRIDTSAAGFTQTPCYAASLIATGEPLSFLQVPFFFTHVHDPGLTGFTFRILFPPLVRDRLASTRVELMADDRRRRFARLRAIVRDEGASVSAFQPGTTVRLLTPDLKDAIHRAPTAIVERVQAEDGTVILRVDARTSGAVRSSDEVQIVRVNGDGFLPEFAETARTLGLTVCWLGCEGAEFAPPACPGGRSLSRGCCDTTSASRTDTVTE